MTFASRSAAVCPGPRVIWKYTLEVLEGGGQHAIPEGSYFLDVQMQHGQIAMWWSVPQNATDRSAWPLRTFTIAGTGPPGYTDNLYYVGTVQDREFVWHVLSWEPIPRATEPPPHRPLAGPGPGGQDEE